MELNSITFHDWRNIVRNKKTYDRDSETDFSYVKEGITIWYHKTKHRKWIKLIINPSRILGLDDLITLWEPNKQNRGQLIFELDKFIEEYFDSEYELKDFTLTRIDFTKNVRLGNKEKVSAYIKFLHNIRKVKGFSPKYGKRDTWYIEDFGFDLEGNSNGIDFTAYDKEAAVEDNMKNMRFKRKEIKERLEMAKGVLRFEVKLTTQKAIRNYTDEEDTVKRINKLSKNSEKIFLDTFIRVVPFGDIYKKDKALKIIEENVDDKKLQKKMLQLLELVPKKKSLYLAQKVLNDRNIDRILAGFHQQNLSPVTISKRQKIKHLKNLYTFF